MPQKPRTYVPADPLRVLRAVRFAARFNCVLEQSVEAAAANEQVIFEVLQGPCMCM